MSACASPRALIGDSMEAIKHPQEGAGVITSLTQTDGLVELPENHDGRAGLDRRISCLMRAWSIDRASDRSLSKRRCLAAG